MEIKTVGVACDHAGFPLKQFVIQYLEQHKYAYKDFDEAIVASGENPVDALAASTLTGKKEAPILLTNRNKIPKSIKKIIEDMDIGKITIVGGESSITDNVMDDMEDML